MAKLITCSNDVLIEYNINTENKIKNKLEFSDLIEENIYNLLILENLTIDELSFKL
jgi:hypothetical protein